MLRSSVTSRAVVWRRNVTVLAMKRLHLSQWLWCTVRAPLRMSALVLRCNTTFCDAADGVPGARTLNVWRFAVLAFFMVCGGPFGVEIAVMAGGPLPTLLGFIVMPFLWSLPQVSVPCVER